ncbi:MAG TPA: hypothetical protein VKD90_24115 [Gemmataceae bacterium]|nr:hypothetical protein [Gemmataceae bacterium]
MSRARRVYLIVGVAAFVGLFLAFVTRGGRGQTGPSASGDPGEAQGVPVALGKPTLVFQVEDPLPVAPAPEPPKRTEPVSHIIVEPKAPAPRPVEDPTLDRRAVYLKIIAAMEKVEAAAIQKYGHKPGPDDKAEFTIPYKAFLNSQTQQARKKLAKDLGLTEVVIDQIKLEGDRAGWARR